MSDTENTEAEAPEESKPYRARLIQVLPYLPNYDLRDRLHPDVVLNIEQAIILHPLRGVVLDSVLRKSIKVSRRLLPPLDDDDQPDEEVEPSDGADVS